jgi:hypothetical protein
MTKPIDIFICAYLRPIFTEQTINYLVERTEYPYRLFLINQGGNDDIAKVYQKEIFMTLNLTRNIGVTAAWQIALSLAESEYFITSDNDILSPNLKPDWLTTMVKFMDERPNYGAISLCPHVFIGAAGIEPNDPEDVKERNMCGAVMRIMRRQAVWAAGGWKDEGDIPLIRPDRGKEERVICSRLQTAGYKTGIASRIRAYHPFGRRILDKEGKPIGNWGYPKDVTPEMQGHRAELAEYVLSFDNMEAYDPFTWLPK